MAESDSSDDEHRGRRGFSGALKRVASSDDRALLSYSLCFVGSLLDFGEDAAASDFVREVPFQVEAPIVQVSCGLDFVCLLTANGRVYSSTRECEGQPRPCRLASQLIPRLLPFPVEKKIVRLSCGASHGGFVVENGALFMFGCSSYGRLGIGDPGAGRYYHVPVQVRMTWSALQAKVDRTKTAMSCGIPVIHQKLRTAEGGASRTTGATMAASALPQVSPETDESRPHEEDTNDSDEIIFADISCGDRHTLVLGAKASSVFSTTNSSSHSSSNALNLVKNSIISFGDGMNGRLGIGSEGDEATGVLVTVFKALQYTKHDGALLPKITSIAAGVTHSAALSSSGELFTWGNGADGQLGHGSYESEWVPRQVEFFKNISLASVKCGAYHTVAVTRLGTVYTWGCGQKGQLGIGHAGLHGTNAQDLGQDQQQSGTWRLPEKVQLVVDPLAIQQMNIDAQVQAAFTTASALSGGGALGGNLGTPSAAAAASQQQLQQELRVTVRSIVATASGNMALDEHARLFSWGCNRDRQLGVPLSETCDKAKCPPQKDTLSHTPAPPAWIVHKPRQVMYMDLRESTTHKQSKASNSSRVTTIRDQVHAVSNAMNEISRQALVHFAASDRYSVLVFKTESVRASGLHGGMGNSSRSNMPIDSVATTPAEPERSERGTSAAPVLSFPNRSQLRLLAQQQQQSGKWKLVSDVLTREQSSANSIGEGLKTMSTGSKWHFSLHQELRTEDVPSKEKEYCKLMASYKVYLRRPDAATYSTAASPGTTATPAITTKFLGLHECDYDIGIFQELDNSNGDDHFSVSMGKNGRQATQREVNTSRSVTSANSRRTPRAPDLVDSRILGSSNATVAAPMPRHVRGFDDWLKKRLPPKSPKRKARPATGNAEPVQRSADTTFSKNYNKKEDQVQSPKLADKAPIADGRTAATRPQSSRVPRVPGSEPQLSMQSPKERPSRPKTAYTHTKHTTFSAHKPTAASPSSATNSNTSGKGTAPAAPVPPPQRLLKSPKRAASAGVRSRGGHTSLKLQSQWQQQELGLSALGSSTRPRFSLESSLIAKDTLMSLNPGTSAPLVYPTPPRFSMGSGEDYSLMVARRLSRARGGTPGPGAYDRHGG